MSAPHISQASYSLSKSNAVVLANRALRVTAFTAPPLFPTLVLWKQTKHVEVILGDFTQPLPNFSGSIGSLKFFYQSSDSYSSSFLHQFIRPVLGRPDHR